MGTLHPDVEMREVIVAHDASIKIDLAEEKFGWTPKYSWRDKIFK